MTFNFIDKNTEEKLENLLKKVKLHKNGVVADAMKKAGLDYEIAWGVSIPDLRKISKAHLNDHRLALLLWNKKWRESMILASMIDDVAKMEEEQLLHWLKDVSNIELAEQLSFNLLSRLNYSAETWINLMNNALPMGRITVLKALYRLVLQRKMDAKNAETLLVYIQNLKVHRKEPTLYLVTALGQLLACIGRTYPQLREVVSTFIYKFASDDPIWGKMVEIVETEFKWLDDV